MNNQERFMSCCESLAYLEQSILILEKIGVKVEPELADDKMNDFPHCLYKASSGPLRVALSYLDLEQMNSVKIENNITNKLLSMNLFDYKEISKGIWDEYGLK